MIREDSEMAVKIDDKAITANKQVLNAVYRIMPIGIQNANYQNKPNYMGFSMMDEQKRMQIKPNKVVPR